MKVTSLKCGGFIFAVHIHHAMGDATGHAQFISAISELARGGKAPTISPVWDRHLLNARSPPRVTYTHREYDIDDNLSETLLLHVDDTVLNSFFFGAAELPALWSHLPPHLRSCSRFDLLTASLWRCRTVAFSPEPDEEVRMMFIMDFRRRFDPSLPVGYYDNAVATPSP